MLQICWAVIDVVLEEGLGQACSYQGYVRLVWSGQPEVVTALGSCLGPRSSALASYGPVVVVLLAASQRLCFWLCCGSDSRGPVRYKRCLVKFILSALSGTPR